MNESEVKRIAVEDRLGTGRGFAGEATGGLIQSALERAGFEIVEERPDALITIGETGRTDQQSSGTGTDTPRRFLIDPVLTEDESSAGMPITSAFSGVACCHSGKAQNRSHPNDRTDAAVYLSPFIDPEPYFALQRDAATLRLTLSQRHRLPAHGKWIFLSITPDTSEGSLLSIFESLLRLSAPDWSLVVSAEARLRPLVEQMMPRLAGKNRHLLASDNPAERRSFLAASDLFLIAERSAGNVHDILEAIASGLAIVAGKSPVIEEVVENGRSGRLSLPGNPASLLNNLSFLLRHDNFLQSHREQSRSQMLARHDILIAAQTLRNLIAPVNPQKENS